jgi:hypothetical protein
MLKNSMERHFFKMSVTVSYLAMELICENEDKRGLVSNFKTLQKLDKTDLSLKSEPLTNH